MDDTNNLEVVCEIDSVSDSDGDFSLKCLIQFLDNINSNINIIFFNKYSCGYENERHDLINNFVKKYGFNYYSLDEKEYFLYISEKIDSNSMMFDFMSKHVEMYYIKIVDDKKIILDDMYNIINNTECGKIVNNNVLFTCGVDNDRSLSFIFNMNYFTQNDIMQYMDSFEKIILDLNGGRKVYKNFYPKKRYFKNKLLFCYSDYKKNSLIVKIIKNIKSCVDK